MRLVAATVRRPLLVFGLVRNQARHPSLDYIKLNPRSQLSRYWETFRFRIVNGSDLRVSLEQIEESTNEVATDTFRE